MAETYHDEKSKVNRQLVDTEEAARVLGVTPRAIQKKFNKGKIEGQFVNSGKGYGKGGQVLKVWIDTDGVPCGVGEAATPQGQTPQGKDRYKVHRGEPGCRVVTPLENGIPIINIEGYSKSTGNGRGDLISAGQLAVPVTRESPQLNLPVAITQSIPPRPIPTSCQKTANLRFALVQAAKEEFSKNSRPKTQTIKSFLEVYNAGISHPDIHSELGSISRATLYNWLSSHDLNGIDGLIPAYGGNAISMVTKAEKEFLHQLLLHQNRRKIADAILQCKGCLGEKSPSSPATLRRYVNTFKSEFHDVWTLDREGQKAWNDKCAPYQDRAWWTLKVGEILVADGHRLNFRVIDPHTGKPSRAVLVLFWDWYSSFPVGWEVMLTENVQCVATALRNAILALGKIPDCVYLDNGKAFKAKCFTRKIILEETEIPGMFARLGINVMFAMKYNAQAKPIERIFGVLEWLERQATTFVGNSINDKPAGLRPNEDRAKKLWGSWTPKLDQVNEMIRQWRDFYSIQPLRGRKNQTAKDLFEPGRGPGIDPKALCFLMLKTEVKGVRRERLTFDGFDWTGDCLYGLKQRVIVRYSLSDRSRVFVFDLNDQFRGIVEPVDYTAPRDHAAARRILGERRRLLRQTKTLSNMAKTASPEVIDLISRKNPDLLEYIQAEEIKKEKPRMLPYVEPEKSVEAEPLSTEDERQRPYFWGDYEKYDWLMEHSDRVTEDDRKWMEDFVSKSSLYSKEESS